MTLNVWFAKTFFSWPLLNTLDFHILWTIMRTSQILQKKKIKKRLKAVTIIDLSCSVYPIQLNKTYLMEHLIAWIWLTPLLLSWFTTVWPPLDQFWVKSCEDRTEGKSFTFYHHADSYIQPCKILCFYFCCLITVGNFFPRVSAQLYVFNIVTSAYWNILHLMLCALNLLRQNRFIGYGVKKKKTFSPFWSAEA